MSSFGRIPLSTMVRVSSEDRPGPIDDTDLDIDFADDDLEAGGGGGGSGIRSSASKANLLIRSSSSSSSSPPSSPSMLPRRSNSARPRNIKFRKFSKHVWVLFALATIVVLSLAATGMGLSGKHGAHKKSEASLSTRNQTNSITLEDITVTRILTVDAALPYHFVLLSEKINGKFKRDLDETESRHRGHRSGKSAHPEKATETTIRDGYAVDVVKENIVLFHVFFDDVPLTPLANCDQLQKVNLKCSDTYQVASNLEFILFESNVISTARHSYTFDGSLYNVQGKTALSLPTGLQYAAFTPSNNLFYILANNIYYRNLYTPQSQLIQLTKDGADTVFNGVPDWVYEEEVFSDRVTTWATSTADGDYLAFLKLVEDKVPIYQVHNYDQGTPNNYPTSRNIRYPKVRLF